jgi:hypothetical protein
VGDGLHFSIVAKGERLTSIHLLIMAMMEKYMAEMPEGAYETNGKPPVGYG